MPILALRNIVKRYGAHTVLDDVSLDVEPGEVVAIIGRSGSGKTTLLRVIAGLEWPDAGSVSFHGEDATATHARDRQVGFVFQHYALFGHLTIFENVAFGLRVRPRKHRPTEAAIATKVHALLELVQLDWLADRFPHQLSGGQRQRIALARALINQPQVLLLDEPLGALDLKLREDMQTELKSLQQRLGITFVFVTHDQGEALSMADRVAVFNQGRIEQLDAPRELYARPDTAFVADFVGSANVVPANLAARLTNRAQAFAIRPELIEVLPIDAPPPPGQVVCDGLLVDVLYHGASSRWHVRIDDSTMIVASQAETAAAAALPAPGSRVRLAWSAASIVPLKE